MSVHKLRKRSILLFTGILCSLAIYGQSHLNAWFRGTVGIPIGAKFELHNEFQHRRQNGLDNSFFLDKNLLSSYRSWLRYHHTDDIIFSISPFAYFQNYKIILNDADIAARPIREFRFSAAIDWKYPITSKLYLVNRNAIEYRLFNNDQLDVIRQRNRFGFRFSFSDIISAMVFNEFLFNISGVAVDHFFDQHRLGLDFQYKLNNHSTLSIGIIRISRLPFSMEQKLHENNVFLNLFYLMETKH